MFFLLLGSFELSAENLNTLGLHDMSDIYTDYYRLCEYIDYHAGDVIIIKSETSGNEWYFVAQHDPKAVTVDGRYIKYSGVYLQTIPDGKKCGIKGDSLPQAIYLGKLLFKQVDYVDYDIVKVRKIFEFGKFVGHTLAEEQINSY